MRITHFPFLVTLFNLDVMHRTKRKKIIFMRFVIELPIIGISLEKKIIKWIICK